VRANTLGFGPFDYASYGPCVPVLPRLKNDKRNPRNVMAIVRRSFLLGSVSYLQSCQTRSRPTQFG
jgi:hypothetical protein